MSSEILHAPEHASAIRPVRRPMRQARAPLVPAGKAGGSFLRRLFDHLVAARMAEAERHLLQTDYRVKAELRALRDHQESQDHAARKSA